MSGFQSPGMEAFIAEHENCGATTAIGGAQACPTEQARRIYELRNELVEAKQGPKWHILQDLRNANADAQADNERLRAENRALHDKIALLLARIQKLDGLRRAAIEYRSQSVCAAVE